MRTQSGSGRRPGPTRGIHADQTRYGFATLLSIYNKWMFSAEYYNFPYPLFVTACHMIVQFAIASLILVTMPDRFRPPEKPTRRDYA